MNLLGTGMIERMIPILDKEAVDDVENKPSVLLLRTLCAMAETDDYEEILRLQGAARFIADDDETTSGAVPGE